MSESRAIALSWEVLKEKSKSFALATRLMPRFCRDDFAVLYAFCRHIDDAIDLAPPESRKAALGLLRTQIDSIYAGRDTDIFVFDAFARVARDRRIPRVYIDELLAGMEMDVAKASYQTLDELYLYAHRVAGVVGLLLCHVMGLRDEPGNPARDVEPLRSAAHLGMAMQLTNICRDVEEDLRDGRVYLPWALLGFSLEKVPAEGSPQRRAVQAAVARLLDEADRFYRSGDRGLASLPLRCALSVRTARLVYSAIGEVLRARACDPFLGRAQIPRWRKFLLVAKAILQTLRSARAQAPGVTAAAAGYREPDRTLQFPADVLPLESSR